VFSWINSTLQEGVLYSGKRILLRGWLTEPRGSEGSDIEKGAAKKTPDRRGPEQSNVKL
jgi:hypothetical protein